MYKIFIFFTISELPQSKTLQSVTIIHIIHIQWKQYFKCLEISILTTFFVTFIVKKKKVSQNGFCYGKLFSQPYFVSIFRGLEEFLRNWYQTFKWPLLLILSCILLGLITFYTFSILLNSGRVVQKTFYIFCF